MIRKAGYANVLRMSHTRSRVEREIIALSLFHFLKDARWFEIRYMRSFNSTAVLDLFVSFHSDSVRSPVLLRNT